MRISIGFPAFAAVAAASFALPAAAFVPTYDNEKLAQPVCGGEVVYVDLDTWRYYHKGNPKFGRLANGRYACAKEAAIDYMDAQTYPTPDDLLGSQLRMKPGSAKTPAAN